MNNILLKFFLILERLGVDRKHLKQYVVFLIVVSIVTFSLIYSGVFSTVGPIIFIVIFGIFFTILWFIAGYNVFRSLLVASIGLSFIIFIGQSYCSLPVVQRTANDSLMTLVGFGFIYVVAQFIWSLYKELFGDKHAREEWRQKGIVPLFKEINGGKHNWLVLVIYGGLVILFVWQVYNVINPIIRGLCVYQ